MAQATVGALRVTLGANTAQYEAGMRRAQTQARATGQSISTSMTRAQAATTRAFAGIRQAAAGFGVGLATAGVAGFAAAGKAALDYAADLGETAQQIGVTVEQLQILSRIALANGASQETLTSSLARLNANLGNAKAGVEAALRPFLALGFTREQLNSFNQGGDALREVAERIERIPDPARRAAAAKALMGRSAQQLIPALSAVAREYDNVAAEAQRMGLLTEAQAARADEASDKLAILANVLKTRLAIAVADNIGPIQQLIEGFAGLATEALRAGAAMQRAADRAIVASRSFFSAARRVLLGSGAINAARFQVMEANAAGTVAAARQRLARGGVVSQFVEGVQGRINAALEPRNPPSDLGGDIDFDLSRQGGGRGRRGGRDDAQRLADEAIRRRHEIESELNRARIDELRARERLTTDAEQRAEINAQISYLEQQQMEADRRLSVLLRERTQGEADTLAEILARNARLERQAIDEEEARRIREEAAQIETTRQGLLIELAEIDADLADTAGERRAAELRLLDLQFQQERFRLKTVAADQTISEAARREAEMRLAALGQIQAGARAGVMRSTMGPLESFLDRLPTTAAKANEALEEVAARGLQSIEDGILSILDGTKSIADAFRDMASSIISDLLRIQIQRMITIPLANALGGGGSGWLSSLLNIGAAAAGGGGGGAAAGFLAAPGAWDIPRFASGGIIRVGGPAGIDRSVLSLNGMPVARVSQGEDLTISPAGRNGSNVYHINVTAPNTGDPRRDRQTGHQLAAMVRDAVARTAKTGH